MHESGIVHIFILIGVFLIALNILFFCGCSMENLATVSVSIETESEGVDCNSNHAVADVHGFTEIFDMQTGKNDVGLNVYRISGKDFSETAINIADEMKGYLGVDQFDAIVLASSIYFHDVLSGSCLASVKNVPVLLADVQDTSDLAAYIEHNVKPGGTIYFLGDIGVFPETLREGLNDFFVKQFLGADSFETNLAVLKETGISTGEILVCGVNSFTDRLLASSTSCPVLLVGDHLTCSQNEFLKGLCGNAFYIIGDTGAVSESIESEIREYGTVTRISGNTQYETSTLVSQTFFCSPNVVVLAGGESLENAACALPLAVNLGAPLLLTLAGYERNAAEYVQHEGVTRGIVVSNPDLISNSMVDKIFGFRGTNKDCIIPKGNPISLCSHNANTSDYLGYPQEEHYGAFFEQAIALYDAIAGNEEEIVLFFPVEWDRALDKDARVASAREISKPFKAAVSLHMFRHFYYCTFDHYIIHEDGFSAVLSPNKWNLKMVSAMGMNDPLLYYDKNILAGLYDGMPEKEAVMKICEWICQNVDYGSGQADPVVALQTGKGSCSAYGKLFLAMCQSAGIDCRYVTGCVYANEKDHTCMGQGCHAWNMVKIGDSWHYLDLSWMDGYNGDINNHYFLTETLWNDRVVFMSFG